MTFSGGLLHELCDLESHAEEVPDGLKTTSDLFERPLNDVCHLYDAMERGLIGWIQIAGLIFPFVLKWADRTRKTGLELPSKETVQTGA